MLGGHFHSYHMYLRNRSYIYSFWFRDNIIAQCFLTYTPLKAWLTTKVYMKYICLWISALVSVTFKHYKDILDITTILLSNHKIFVTMFYQKYVSSMSPLTANSTQGIFFSFFLLPFLQLIGLGVTLIARW